MRTRFLSVIVAFLLVSVAVSSCLNSDNNLEYTTDATISSFSLDTIYGVDYKFEIDQLNNLIYNPDSLPVSADTIIDSIMVDQLGAVWGVTSADTTFSTETYHNLLPAMNATGDNGVKLTVYGGDALSTRTYTLQIRVHRQDPDSLTWVHMDTVGAIFSTAVNQGEQKAVALNGEVRLYTSPTEMYRTSGAPGAYGWTRNDVSGLPAAADISSLIAFGDRLYMLAEGDVYVSDATGTAWQRSEGLSGNVQALVASMPANNVSGLEATLSAIRLNGSGTQEFCTTTDGEAWTTGDDVPDGFPQDHFYYTNYTTGGGAAQVMITGMPLSHTEKTIPWFSNDGKSWAALETEREGMWCPALSNPCLIHYDEQFYAFGGEMDTIYTSESGIGWQGVERKFLLPPDFAGKQSYTVAIDATPEGAATAADKRNFIWVIFGGNGTPNEVWRGRLNKLGFERE